MNNLNSNKNIFHKSSMLLSTIVLATFVAIPTQIAHAANHPCKALFTLKDADVPAWFKTELRANARKFFDALDVVEVPAGRAVRLDTEKTEMKKISNFVARVLKNRAEWREFTVALAIELAETLNERGILKENRWRTAVGEGSTYYSSAYASNPEEVRAQKYARTKANPVLKEMIRKKLYRYGFRKTQTIRNTMSETSFRNLLADGKIFWDNAFVDQNHGADTHMLQVLLVAQRIEDEFGKDKVLKFYKFMGTAEGHDAWSKYFDGLSGDLYQPERMSPVLWTLLPGR